MSFDNINYNCEKCKYKMLFSIVFLCFFTIRIVYGRLAAYIE